MKILEINNVDFSDHVNQQSWKIQNAKEYASWIDGNRITHKTQTREKITGTFNIAFLSPDEYDGFRSAIDEATSIDGYTAITIYVDNEHQLMDIDAFLTMSTKTVWTQMEVGTTVAQLPYLFQVTVKVEQR